MRAFGGESGAELHSATGGQEGAGLTSLPAEGAVGGDWRTGQYPSLQLAASTSLDGRKTVGVQVHKRFAPWFVSQIQAPSAKTSIVHCQWLPKYPRREEAALAYDIANAWRAIKGLSDVTEQNARFNFPEAGYLQDSNLRARLESCHTFADVKALIREELLLEPPFPAELRQEAVGDGSSGSGSGQGGAGAAGLGKLLVGRVGKAVARQSGRVLIELTAARLRDCRVYLKPEVLAQAFQWVPPSEQEVVAGSPAWPLIQAAVADEEGLAERLFDLPFGTPGRDGLPLMASELRVMLKFMQAKEGDVLQLQYKGQQGSTVQVNASLASGRAGKAPLVTTSPVAAQVPTSAHQPLLVQSTPAAVSEGEVADWLMGMQGSRESLPAGGPAAVEEAMDAEQASAPPPAAATAAAAGQLGNAPLNKAMPQQQQQEHQLQQTITTHLLPGQPAEPGAVAVPAGDSKRSRTIDSECAEHAVKQQQLEADGGGGGGGAAGTDRANGRAAPSGGAPTKPAGTATGQRAVDTVGAGVHPASAVQQLQPAVGGPAAAAAEGQQQQHAANPLKQEQQAESAAKPATAPHQHQPAKAAAPTGTAVSLRAGEQEPATVDPSQPIQLMAGLRALLRLSGVEKSVAQSFRLMVANADEAVRREHWRELIDAFLDGDQEDVQQWVQLTIQ